MSRIYPSLPTRTAVRAGDYAELALLEALKRGLSDAYTLFHSVDWARATGTLEQHGEIDIVVINQAGDVLLVEVGLGCFRPEALLPQRCNHLDFWGDRLHHFLKTVPWVGLPT